MARTAKSTKEKQLEKEVEDLKREIETLKNSSSFANRFSQFVKKVSVFILVVLCALSINLAVAAGWLKQNITNTQTWVANTDAMLNDPIIRGNVSARITNELFETTDVAGVIAEVIPPRAQALAVPLTNSLKSQVQERVNNILASEKFQTYWNNVNTSAHAGIISSLENGGQKPANTDQYIVYIDNEQLLLNLKPIVQNIQSDLAQDGLSFVSNIDTNNINKTVVLTQIPALPQVLTAFEILNKSFVALSVLAVIFGAVAVIIAENKRKVLIGISLSIIVLMALNVQAIYLAKYPLANQAASALNSSTSTSAQQIFDILTSSLVYYNRVLMAIALIVCGAAILSGPSKFATWIRTSIGNLTSNKNDNKLLSNLSDNSTTYISILGSLSVIAIVFNPTSSVVFPLVVLITSCLLSLWILSVKAARQKT